MKKSVLLVLMVLFALQSFSQTKNESKQGKKEQKIEEQNEAIKNYHQLVSSRKFIVEANSVYGNSGDSYTVSPSVNYFYIDSLNATIQLAFDGLVGYNGVGGVTIDGKIEKFDLVELKEGKPVSLSGTIQGNAGAIYTFTMYVNSSGLANVQLNGNWSNTVNFQGRILNLARSKVFKGMPLN